MSNVTNTLTFELTVDQVNVILMQLEGAPYKVAKPIIDSIMGQGNKQIAPNTVEESEKEEE